MKSPLAVLALAALLGVSPRVAVAGPMRMTVSVGGGTIGSAGIAVRGGASAFARVEAPVGRPLLVGLEASAADASGEGFGTYRGALHSTQTPTRVLALAATSTLEGPAHQGTWAPYVSVSTGVASLRMAEEFIVDPARSPAEMNDFVPEHALAAWTTGVGVGLWTRGPAGVHRLDFGVRYDVLVGPDRVHVFRAHVGVGS